MVQKYECLTQADIDHFMERGFVVVKGGFSLEKAEEWTKEVWVRLGIEPNDKSKWPSDKVNMPFHNKEDISTFAAKAWAAMKDLLGGEERIAPGSSMWSDAFIVNLGGPEWVDKYIDPRDLDNWHVDGDLFVHYLDSPEQGLLVTPIFTKIVPRGGGTYICPEGIGKIARYLADHPEGVLPTGLSFTPSTFTGEKNEEAPGYWSMLKEVKKYSDFVEMVGDVGDVVLMHPLMLHSASKNHLRIPRIITNPPVSLKEPFNFNRENPDDYSLVERKTLKELGVDKLDFKPTTERRRVVPRRIAIQQKMLEEEKKRLAALKAEGAPLDGNLQPVAVA